MPSKAQAIFCNWMIIDGLIHHMKDNVENTEFEDMHGIIGELSFYIRRCGTEMKKCLLDSENDRY